MIKTLQRKFIITAMIAISVLIIVLLGTINVVNISHLGNQSDMLLEMITRDEGVHPEGFGEPGVLDGDVNIDFPNDYNNVTDVGVAGEQDAEIDQSEFEKPEKRPWDHNIFNPVINEDTAMSARYFLVRADEDGNIVNIDVSRISSVSKDEAKEYATNLLTKGRISGEVDSFKYMVKDSADGRGTVIVFLNIANQYQAIFTVLLTSAGIGILCWMLMLLLVVILSNKAIRPIAVNMDKQKQFVTDAGHEIKTPLAIILANTDAMELHNGESKWSKNIRTQTTRLSGLMQNLLTLSRMDEADHKVVMSDVDISILVNEAVDSFTESAKLKGIIINADITSDIVFNANREQMIQLISILMDNAVKFSLEKSDIDVSLHGTGKNPVLSIRNICDKLPKGLPEKLFDRFYRGDSARTQKSGGYGIGLSVARAIVEIHKGAISAEYGEDNAITFLVEF